MSDRKTRLVSLNNLKSLDKDIISIVVLATLISLQLLLYWRYLLNFSEVLIRAIFVVSIFGQVYQKQRKLRLVGDFTGNLVGIVLIFLLLFRAKYIFLAEASVFSYLSPWLLLIGYILLIAGFKGIRQYRREIMACIVVNLVPLLSPVLNMTNNGSNIEQFSIEVITAKSVSFLLWYLGFDSVTQGTLVYVNGGGIDIYWGCTAMPILFQILRFAFLLILVFPDLCCNLWLPIVLSFILSFVFSTIRLVIMALVVKDEVAFAFWHGIQGGNLFVTLGLVTFFAIILYTAPPRNRSPKPTLLKYQPKTPSWLLLSSSVALLLILFNFIGDTSPIAGANRIADYEFPRVINIAGWQLQNTQALPLIPLIKDDHTILIQIPPAFYNLPLAQRSYSYKRNDEKFTLNLRYIVNTSGDIKGYYQSFQNLPKLESYTEVKEDDNYYLKFMSQGRRYWTTCLNVEGNTTVTASQFLASSFQDSIQSAKLLDWLMGKRPLRDRRCLWIEVSISENSALNPLDKMKIWTIITDYWRISFPSLRN